MIKKIVTVIAFYLIGMVPAMVAQTAVIDLSQTIFLEGSALKLSIIVHQADKAFFTLDLVDNTGRAFQNHAIYSSEGVNRYALAVPTDIDEQAWLVIRNGDQTQVQELLILPRPMQLAEEVIVESTYDQTTESPAQKYRQTERICLKESPAAMVYLSSTATAFNGSLLHFDQVKAYVHYPVKVESGQINQAFIFDTESMKSMQTKQESNSTVVKLASTSAGSTLIAINKLTNLPEKLNFTNAAPAARSIFSKIDEENKKWLANQLLIDEVLKPLADTDFSVELTYKKDTNWQAELGTPTVDLQPQDYVSFDDMKSFLGELARALKLYPLGEGFGSYVYPINKKASIRQPLYLIDGQIAVIDELLAMKQNDILSIQIYNDVQSLLQILGPVASAGLIIVKSAEPKKSMSNATIGQALDTINDKWSAGPLSPVAFMGASSQNCYDHNKRLGNFTISGLSIEGRNLKVHSEQITITPLSK